MIAAPTAATSPSRVDTERPSGIQKKRLNTKPHAPKQPKMFKVATNQPPLYQYASDGDHRDQLVRLGFCILPFAGGHLAAMQKEFDQFLLDAPEFKCPSIEDATCLMVLGGFGALGTPSSFHHEWIRRKREELMHAVITAGALPINGRFLEKPFDRVTFRRKGQTPTAESLHRDEAETALQGDDVFGGWLNLDSTDQFFHACPCTHTEVGGQNKGFAKITDPALKKHYKQQLRRICVPPGHLLIFYERIVHEVAPNVAATDMRRIHCGWRLTHSALPLFPETFNWIGNQSVPKIKSGQDPVVYPSAYSNFSRHWDELEKWSLRNFGHLEGSALYRHTIKSKNPEFDGKQFWRVQAKFPSMRTLNKKNGIAMHRPYDSEERSVHFPSRHWHLHTLGSTERVPVSI